MVDLPSETLPIPIKETGLDSIGLLRNTTIANILTSVVTDGLLPANELAKRKATLVSGDDAANPKRNKVSGVIVMAENMANVTRKPVEPYYSAARQDGVNASQISYNIGQYEGQFIHNSRYSNSILDTSINNAFYEGVCSVFPVMLERENESREQIYKLNKKTINERLQSTALVVMKSSSFLDLQYNEPSLLTAEVHMHAIPPDKIYAVLIPRDLLPLVPAKTYEEQGIRIIPVDLKTSSIFTEHDPLGGQPHARRALLPDYENEVKKIIGEIGEPLFLHCLRLPTLQDVRSPEVTP